MCLNDGLVLNADGPYRERSFMDSLALMESYALVSVLRPTLKNS